MGAVNTLFGELGVCGPCDAQPAHTMVTKSAALRKQWLNNLRTENPRDSFGHLESIYETSVQIAAQSISKKPTLGKKKDQHALDLFQSTLFRTNRIATNVDREADPFRSGPERLCRTASWLFEWRTMGTLEVY